jgi:nicotinamide mononucleotide transporter
VSTWLESVLRGFAASTLLEIVAVVLGVAYSLLAVGRNRFCWIAGAGSSALLAYLAAARALPMQAALQAFYVAMSAYGFWRWSQSSSKQELSVGFWPPTHHIAVAAVLFLLSFFSARLLAAETQAAWPFLDSLTTWFSLFATWLVARARIENWLYWIIIDGLLVILYGAQGLSFISLLYAIYLAVAIFGFAIWLKKYRVQRQEIRLRHIF